MLRREILSAAAALLLLVSVRGAAVEDIGYDPTVDPFAQLEHGVTVAHEQDKLVLMIAGGDWCIWCHYLNAFIDNNADIDKELHDTFVVVKVYVGEKNKNEKFFASWPKADGAPHFWIFSADGNLLSSQPTVVLEDGAKSYDKQEFLRFIGRWKDRS